MGVASTPVPVSKIKKIGDMHFRESFTSVGTTTGRPSLASVDKGFTYYDTDINCPIWWNGTDWINATTGVVCNDNVVICHNNEVVYL